jgi:sortase A
MPSAKTGNVVVAGHRVTHTRPFRHLDSLRPGDEIIFTVNGIRSVYSVTGSQVVTPKQTEIVNQTSAPTATLFACHPPGSARYRYVIHAALASTSPA